MSVATAANGTAAQLAEDASDGDNDAPLTGATSKASGDDSVTGSDSAVIESVVSVDGHRA